MKSARYNLRKNIRILRNKAGISQEKLADRAALHRTYIGAVERGERNISLINIEKIASALDIEPYKLLKEDLEADFLDNDYVSAIESESFNDRCVLPYGLSIKDVEKSMDDFLHFLKFINTQLSNIKLSKLEYLLMPANFSSMVGEFMINSISKYCRTLARNNYHNGHPDLLPKGKYKNNAVQYSNHGIEIKASRHSRGWQGHNPENIWIIVFYFNSNSANDQFNKRNDIPFKFKGVFSAYLDKDDWNFSGRSEDSRRTITASINKKGVNKMKDNWIYRST